MSRVRVRGLVSVVIALLFLAAFTGSVTGSLVGRVFFSLSPTPDIRQLVNQAVATAMAGDSTAGSAATEPTAAVTAAATATATAAVTSTAQPTPAATAEVVVTAGTSVSEVFRAQGSLEYPALTAPDASKWLVFPNELVRYEAPFEDGDYFETGHGDIDLPQYYFRVITAGEIEIPQLGISCIATPEKGCAVILINHFGETVMFRNTVVDNGFTVAGLVFDMSTPEKVVTEVAQALLSHYMFRMTMTSEGANCGTVTACESVEWHVVVVGNGKVQVHWTGLFRR